MTKRFNSDAYIDDDAKTYCNRCRLANMDMLPYVTASDTCCVCYARVIDQELDVWERPDGLDALQEAVDGEILR